MLIPKKFLRQGGLGPPGLPCDVWVRSVVLWRPEAWAVSWDVRAISAALLELCDQAAAKPLPTSGKMPIGLGQLHRRLAIAIDGDDSSGAAGIGDRLMTELSIRRPSRWTPSKMRARLPRFGVFGGARPRSALCAEEP
jgi:hypothetical protein